MSSKRYCFHLALVLLASFLFAVSVSALGTPKVIVELTDGNTVEGVLLQLTTQFVKIDPEGPVSLRTIPADEVSSVHVTDTGHTYTFPLSEDEIPSDLSQEVKFFKVDRRSGFRSFAITLSGGLTSTAFGSKSGDYYEGIGSGPGFQIAIRYRFPEDDRYRKRFFLGLTYRFSSPGLEQESYLVGWYGTGNPVYVEFEHMYIHHIGFEAGVTTNAINKDSYFYFLMGAVALENKLTGHVRIGGGTEATDTPSTTVSDGVAAGRLGVGGVIGLTPRIGLAFSLTADLLLTQRTDFIGQTYTSTYGGLLIFDVGLEFEL